MLQHKPISVERARVRYFQSVNDVRFATNEIERDRARSASRKANQVLQHAQRIERNQKAASKRAIQRRRVDWNLPDF